MKFLIWAGVVVVALFWTLTIAIMASLAQWLAGSTEQAVGGLQAISQWPIPAWLSLWVDPALLEPIKAMMVWGIDFLVTATPWLEPFLAWVAPLLWVAWSLIMLVLLVIALSGHFVVGKLGRSNTARL